MIGIIGAMEVEVTNLIAKLSGATTEVFSGISYVKGKLGEVQVVVSQCGMGKVNAAVCAQTMVLKYAPTLIINTGVAGSVSPEVGVGDIVIGQSAVQHDFDLSPIGMEKGYIHELKTIEIPCAMAGDLEKAAQRLGYTCYTGVIATGDQFINCGGTKETLRKSFNALACEMEGASIAHVCALGGVDFALVRTISDNADGEATHDFTQFMQEAAEKSVALIVEALIPSRP